MAQKGAKGRTQKLTVAAMLGALVFVATWISVPTPFGGNVNLGDSILLLAAWLPLEPWSILACAIGATLTDLAAGYAIYAPATLVIKALMVAVAVLIKHKIPTRSMVLRALVGGVAAELVMVIGYLAYEAIFLYGTAAWFNVPFNLLQGGIAMTVATTVAFLFVRVPMPAVLRFQGWILGKDTPKKDEKE